MTTPDRLPHPEHNREGVITSPEAITAFVTYAVLAFEAHGSEFLTEEADPDLPMYSLADASYDPQLTPHLSPFKTVSVSAYDLSKMRGPSHVEFVFDISADTAAARQVVRELTLWDSGEIDDKLLGGFDAPRDPDEPTKPASYSREDIRAYMDYLLGKESLQEAIDMMEGMPDNTPGLTIGEIEDLVKLLPSEPEG